MLMYEYYRGHAGDTGGYGVSIYVHCNRLGFVSVCGGVMGEYKKVRSLEKCGWFALIKKNYI